MDLSLLLVPYSPAFFSPSFYINQAQNNTLTKETAKEKTILLPGQDKLLYISRKQPPKSLTLMMLPSQMQATNQAPQ